jgi:hypothetical protein
MKGTILDFLKLATEKPELAQELVDLAAKHDFEFSDEVRDTDLEEVAGGSTAYFKKSIGGPGASNMWSAALSLLKDHAQRDTQEEADLTRI